jgi:hypothetical protein
MLEPISKKPSWRPHSYTLTSKKSLGCHPSNDVQYFLCHADSMGDSVCRMKVGQFAKYGKYPARAETGVKICAQPQLRAICKTNR